MSDFMNSDHGRRNKRYENVMRIRGAVIEEISRDRNTGYVTVSYGAMGEFKMLHVMLVTLLVNRDTVLQNQFGQKMRFQDLEEGMTVDADISSRMTSSIPPQARAFKIVAKVESNSSNTKIGRVLIVDTDNDYFIIGEADDLYSQIRFNVSESTIILDRRGHRVRLNYLRPGQMVKVEHAMNMTFSIPPQTTAFIVQIL